MEVKKFTFSNPDSWAQSEFWAAFENDFVLTSGLNFGAGAFFYLFLSTYHLTMAGITSFFKPAPKKTTEEVSVHCTINVTCF
jgi:hypothetical protein